MTSDEMTAAAKATMRRRAAKDAAMLRFVGLAVTIAAKAEKKRQFLAGFVYYRVEADLIDRLKQAARDAGFDIKA